MKPSPMATGSLIIPQQTQSPQANIAGVNKDQLTSFGPPLTGSREGPEVAS